MNRVRAAALVMAIGTPSFAQQTPPPLSLADATSAALKQVSAYEQARIDEAIAAQDVHQANAALLPRVRDSFSITYNSQKLGQPSFIAANAIHEYQNLLGVTGEWNFGSIAEVRRARALLDAAHAGTEVARRALIRGVAESYYGAALATARRAAAEQSLAAAEEFERVTELNARGGEVPDVDAIRARLQTAARRDDLLQARQNEAVANATIATLLGSGITPAVIEPLPQTIDTADVAALTPDSAARRPEVAQLESQVRAAHADIGVARGGWLPRITYSLDRGFDSPSLATQEIRQHRGVLATANVDVPLFDWGSARSKQRQAELRAQSAEMQRTITLRDLRLQFETAREEATTAAQRVDNAQRALADAERNATISVARYRAGEAPITEATDAQTTLAQQRLALQQALFDYYVARTHLREAAGE
jgi:outer membrane protein TolC